MVGGRSLTERGTIVSTTPANTNPTLARRVEHRPGNSSMQDCLRRTVGRWRSDHHQICPSNPTPARIAPATESCSISAIGKGKLPYILFSSGKTLAVFVWWHRCTIFFGRTYRPLQWYVGPLSSISSSCGVFSKASSQTGCARDPQAD